MKRGVKIFLIILILSIIALHLIRTFSPREIDDVNPMRNCEQEYLEKSDILWVIPLYKNYDISQNQTWCEEIKSLNKTLELHGIYHSYHEFDYYVNETELENAIKVFEKCFNESPTMFKPPYLHISKTNRDLIKKHNMKLKYRFNQVIHKVYHCNNAGMLPNKFHDIF